MTTQHSEYFELLKRAVVTTLQESHPGVNDDIQEWKGHTIRLFQHDMLEKVNDQFSEKWFYTHMKAHSTKLPRSDMLNLLSKYAGYEDWQDFRHKNSPHVVESAESHPNRIFVIVPMILLVVMAVIFSLHKFLSAREYQFCFVSLDSPSVIPKQIQVELLNDTESPTLIQGDENGCITLRPTNIKVRFVVQAPYYKADTIVRNIKKFSNSEIVQLKTDNYAMMLNYFSSNATENWTKRREQLNSMFADSARIFEVFKGGTTGLELYNKQEFIDKLSVPTNSLRQIDILHTHYEQGKIMSLRFTQAPLIK